METQFNGHSRSNRDPNPEGYRIQNKQSVKVSTETVVPTFIPQHRGFPDTSPRQGLWKFLIQIKTQTYQAQAGETRPFSGAMMEQKT
ncbi:hypothetical protein PoB_007662700 [Plakobranchus ocellatus]|uniref:Uncharacterized protein n=1 Tax=Plakobranchus ocellatus TaxID=259542 RepID=A0AAV4E1F2_9GAST|nr:hypothetical protein PoB_007662700 [Plakobranchus ocellatus]